jgi:large subunit ribosomal protein L27
VKQRGTRFHVGKNVFKAKDDSLHTYIDGVVKFERKDRDRMQVSVYPL